MYFSFYLQWDVGMCHRQWYVDELSLFISSVVRWYISLIPSVGRWYMLSSVVRRCISPSTFSGTLVCVIVSGTSMNYFSFYLQWDVGMCYRQWYVDELSLFISSVVRWYISLIPSVGRWYMLSSVVRRCISPSTFSGTLVCVIVSGTVVYLFNTSSG